MAPAASALLVWLAMPELGFSLLLWVSLVPLLLALASCHGNRECFCIGYLYGLCYAALCVKWIMAAPSFPLAGYLAMVAWIALFPALFALLLGLLIRGTGWPLWVAAPPIWTAVEYLRVIIPVVPSPLALLGHAFYRELPLLQLASATSVYGLTFLVLLVNAALTDLVRAGFLEKQPRRNAMPVRHFLLPAVVAVLAPVSMYAWGMLRMANPEQASSPVMTVAAVQANIPQSQKWLRDQRRNILDRHRELSVQAAQDKPDLVVWPETAIPGDLRHVVFYREYLAALARELSVPLLVGSAAGDKDGSAPGHDYTFTNSAFLINTRGEIVDEYRKVKLLAFAEQIPFGGNIPWPAWMTPHKYSFTPGDGVKLLQISQTPFGVVICWENLFPDLFRLYVDQGAQIMINMTNEAWFGDSEGGYYLLASAVFRAAENGVSLLRVANTGVSALIGPHGTILDKVTDLQGKDLMVPGVMTVAVPAPLSPTIYRKYGDYFAIACVLMGCLMLFVAPVYRRAARRT